MARTKLKRLAAVKELLNVFTAEELVNENKVQEFFKSDGPFTLEIGCGHGDCSVELGKKFPDRNFIGMDIKGARIYKGALRAMDAKLKNVAFIIGKAEKLNDIFKPSSIEEIYIPFPDPHVRRTSENRRLISPAFLKLYKEILLKEGTVHFKTDNKGLFDYALKVINNHRCRIEFLTTDLYGLDEEELNSEIKSNYEKHYIKEGRKICGIRFKF